MAANWTGQEAEEVRSWHRLQTIAPVFVFSYAIVMSMFAIDWAMSLEPHWYSTIFGIYNFAGIFSSGLAAIIVLVVVLLRLGPRQVGPLHGVDEARALLGAEPHRSGHVEQPRPPHPARSPAPGAQAAEPHRPRLPALNSRGR